MGLGAIKMYPRHEMLDLVVVDGQRPGHRHPRPGDGRDRVVRRRRGGPGDRRLRHRLLPVDQRQGLQRHGHLARLQARGGVRQPLLHADPPDLHPGHRRVPVQADADVRVAPQRRPHLGAQEEGRHPAARTRSPRTSATTTWSASTRASATSAPATSPRARPRRSATRAAASARPGWASTSTSPTRSAGSARHDPRALRQPVRHVRADHRRGPLRVPMRIYPAVHYTMGGLWVDYNLMSTIPGLFVLRRGELLRPRRQPAGRQRAHAGAGRRLLHHSRTRSATTSRSNKPGKVGTDHAAFKERRGRVD